MPLTPTDEFLEQSGDVLFAMCDGEKRVVCRVSGEALDDVVGTRTSTSADRLKCFAMHRDQIMKIASDQYDGGEAKPIVRSADLT
jgi:hypothetical protein